MAAEDIVTVLEVGNVVRFCQLVYYRVHVEDATIDRLLHQAVTQVVVHGWTLLSRLLVVYIRW